MFELFNKIMSKQFCCFHCGETFKDQRYLDVHVKKSKVCIRTRGTLFVCLKCNNFFTMKYEEIKTHNVKCIEKKGLGISLFAEVSIFSDGTY